MIRKAKKSDFEFIYPILKQIFDEMDMASIKKLPESQFYDLMRLGFISEYYRYSYRRTWVYADTKDKPIGMVAMYSYEDQKVIDFVLKKEYAKVDLATDTVIFDDKEAWPNEWYVDSLAVTSKHWGEHIASSLLDYAFKIAEQKRFNKVSLNVDKENPRAQKLYVHKGFKTVDKMTIGDRNYDHMIKKV
ncbi:GNAT family N-acetyltransferase [Lactobacillus acetotolerans]|uniref:GNAT family N-acetyltransferase n=1 Tax=Lactobacillus acetotolerans TaxID=1600 RepID=UPI000E9BC1A6|nr:GNAT family N-acetyltransferase [Lactobacillus acetotolerans]MBN7276146.1 GNAT family N-acetyltransferase [Lactobacillus acetotolerans]QJD73294.1 GNAT family N-acetyltransferase [Lactobacillus acetotolerans]HBG90716.1 GNAT family N-acetyltransferase [Lactobacillus acetotolerans]HCX40237.1 GNAT family N-acetyltransferase [Lactobacillus acetotolerans]